MNALDKCVATCEFFFLKKKCVNVMAIRFWFRARWGQFQKPTGTIFGTRCVQDFSVCFFGVNDQQDDENRQRVLLIGFLVGAYTKKVAEK